MDILAKYKRVLVVGLGYRTGLAAANFCAARGCEVSVSDVKGEADLRDIIARLDGRVKVFAGSQEPALLDRGFDMIVLSPGVPAAIPLITEARRRNVPVIAEIELAYHYLKGIIVAITGTDGKSTTTTLTGHVLNAIGIDTIVGGNIGIPLISLVEKAGERTVSVVELSSFQLETIDRFRPHVAAILNIGADHLDRYSGMEDYFAAKLRIALNQDADDWFISNLDDTMLTGGTGPVRARKQWFSAANPDADCFVRNGWLMMNVNGSDMPVLDTARLQIMGPHNVQNVMATLLMVRAVLARMGLEPGYGKLAEACCSFRGLEHRMEPAGGIRGRNFINDSKATTVGAVTMALGSITGKCVIILGGRTKGDDYSRLRGILREKARAIVLIGESSGEFSKLFSDLPHVVARSMDDAVGKAAGLSHEGDAVLLSPACASFDMYRNFEERGRSFKESVEKLRRGEIQWT